MGELSKRQTVVLAALAAQPAATFAPVQVQKLFFLLDKNVADNLGGPQFSFEPYDYGPFDRSVYDELNALAANGLVSITSTPDARRRGYTLTAAGYEAGLRAFNGMPQRARDYMVTVSNWVRSVSFAELVGAIYKQFPEMRARSVFRG